MPESFKEHFTTVTTAKEESPSGKREEGLTKAVQDYQKITDLIREIETLFEGEKRDYESEVQTIVNNLQEALEQGADPRYVVRGLAGVGTEAAMKLRERLLKQGADPDDVARGLAGVNTPEAEEFRRKHFGHDPALLALSYSTPYSEYNGFICRYGYEKL